jgi:hypothetical protein
LRQKKIYLNFCLGKVLRKIWTSYYKLFIVLLSCFFKGMNFFWTVGGEGESLGYFQWIFQNYLLSWIGRFSTEYSWQKAPVGQSAKSNPPSKEKCHQIKEAQKERKDNKFHGKCNEKRARQFYVLWSAIS